MEGEENIFVSADDDFSLDRIEKHRSFLILIRPQIPSVNRLGPDYNRRHVIAYDAWITGGTAE